MQDTKTISLAARAVVAQQAPARARVVSGGDLVPRIDPSSISVQRESLYWVGSLPGLPTEHVDLCGVNFPKVNEMLVPDPMRSDRKVRVPVIGAIARISVAKLRAIQERLQRTVVRFYDDVRPVKDEPGTGENIGDVHQRPRRGQVITIPRAADIE
ncbi:MAG: hypothetical protein RIS45_1786, partial [Planctomycetota bacterium]